LMIELNNPHIQGTWTKEIETLLAEIHIEFDDDFKALQFDNLEISVSALLKETIDAENKTTNTVAVGDDKYMVLVTCENEKSCEVIFDELQKRGFECKVIT